MLILSFDVGIKNLAYCLLEYDPYKKTKLIKKWDIVNLSYYDTVDPDMLTVPVALVSVVPLFPPTQ